MVHYSLMFQCIFPLYQGKLPGNHSITTKTETLIVINTNIWSLDVIQIFPYSHFKTVQYYLYFSKRKKNHKNACTSAQLPKSKSLVKPSVWTLARRYFSMQPTQGYSWYYHPPSLSNPKLFSHQDMISLGAHSVSINRDLVLLKLVILN